MNTTLIYKLKEEGLTDYGLAKLAKNINSYLIKECDKIEITEEDWEDKYNYGNNCEIFDDFGFDDMGKVLFYL